MSAPTPLKGTVRRNISLTGSIRCPRGPCRKPRGRSPGRNWTPDPVFRSAQHLRGRAGAEWWQAPGSLVRERKAVQDDCVRVTELTGCTLAAVAALWIGTASAAQERPDSGVHGLVLYGPTCPVQRPGQTCVRPFRASVTIRREPAGTLAALAQSGADGRFTARLRAGHYLLQPHNGKPYPRAQPQVISVSRYHFTSVTIRFDSGIR